MPKGAALPDRHQLSGRLARAVEFRRQLLTDRIEQRDNRRDRRQHRSRGDGDVAARTEQVVEPFVGRDRERGPMMIAV